MNPWVAALIIAAALCVLVPEINKQRDVWRKECSAAGGIYASGVECWSIDGTRRLFPSDSFKG